MIKNYTDHAANERTFLAWVRTAVAIIGFGFLIERIGVLGLAGNQISNGDGWTNWTGLSLMGLGLTIFLLSLLRFLTTRRYIKDEKLHEELPAVLDVSIAVILAVLSSAMIIYVMHVNLV